MSVASLLKNNQSDDENIFGAYVCDDDTTQALVQVLNEREWSPSLIKTGGIESAIRTLATTNSPRFLLVDLSKSDSHADDMNALAEVCEPGTIVIALGTKNDIALYRDLVGSGVQDYLVKPVTTDQLRETLNLAEQSLRMPEEEDVKHSVDETDKLVAVVGMRGGVGCSTIASSCAWIIANEKKRPTALLDMDIYFGTDALTFDLEPGRGLCDALENPSRVDSLFIERAMIKESENLSILGAEASLTNPTYTDPAALSHLMAELKSNFKYVILDLPRNMAADYPLILSEANEIILVSDLSLAGTRDMIRFMSFCKSVAPEAKVKIVLNKVASSTLVEVDKKDFEASIECSTDHEIPLDQKLMVQVSRSGKPLPQAASMSKVVKILHNICDEIIGSDQETEKVSFWKKITG